MISEALIELLALKHAPPVHPDYVGCDDWHDFARAIEREAYKAGQESMRGRAVNVAANHYDELIAGFIRNLEIEEPK